MGGVVSRVPRGGGPVRSMQHLPARPDRANSLGVAAEGDDGSSSAHGSGTVRMWHPPAAALHTASAAGAPQGGQAGPGRQTHGQRQSLDSAAAALAPAPPEPTKPSALQQADARPNTAQWLL